MASLLTPAPLAAADLPAMPPTQDDLPYDDGVPAKTLRHQFQFEPTAKRCATWPP